MFHEHLQRLAREYRQKSADALDEKEPIRVVRNFCREMGQLPEPRVRSEFMKLTKIIHRPDLTRAHDLRHLFASRAQELGMNPILVQELLSHKSLEMTRRYTHSGLNVKRDALMQAAAGLLGKK